MAARSSTLVRLAGACRNVTAGILAGVLRGRSSEQMHRWLRSRPAGRQALVIGATLGLLLALALVMAQFGWIGLAIYFAAIILIVR